MHPLRGREGGGLVTTLTPADLAKELQLRGGEEAALRLLRAGTVPGFKVGRHWRVDSDELAEWKRTRAARPSDPHRIAPRSSRSQAALDASARRRARAEGRFG